MGFTSFQIRAALTTVLALSVMGCGAGSDATGPTEEHPAIPQLTTAACAVWSCSIGDCQQDPALYGACCIQAATTEYPATSAPSCSGPPAGGGDPAWCGSGNSIATCMDKAYVNHTSAYGCGSSPYVDGGGFAYNPGTSGYNADFPECF